jgi:hypothetical protein
MMTFSEYILVEGDSNLLEPILSMHDVKSAILAAMFPTPQDNLKKFGQSFIIDVNKFSVYPGNVSNWIFKLL